MDDKKCRAVGPLLLMAGIALQALHPSWAAADPLRLGVLGDSNSDEYRADDDRGGRYADVTFNWVEMLEQLRDVDVGAWGTRSEPRRSGYEHNWARSGARANDLISQQSGLAQQIREGKVEYVVIHIGTNDFHPEGPYGDIYDGTVSGSALQQKVAGALADIRSAIRTMTGAGAKVLVTGVPDAGIHPVYRARYPNAARRQVVTDAIDVINTALRADADSNPDVVYSDITAFFQTVLARIDDRGNVIVGGERIELANRGSEPHHMQLDDGSGHAGTVMSGLMANGMFLGPLNQAFDTGVAPLEDEELLCIAGIDTAANCSAPPDPDPDPGPNPDPVPDPPPMPPVLSVE